MFGHIILIAAQVNSQQGVSALESVTFGVFSEVQRGTASGITEFQRLWNGYIWLRGVHAENEQLKQRLAAALVELQQQRAMADKSRRLERLLALRESAALKTAAAEIIASSATPEFHSVSIDKGEDEGVQRDMAVIAADGVVGRVVIPSARNAKVQLLIDRNAAAGAVIERSRAQGVAVGTGERLLRLEYVSEVADVVEGDVVVSSGLDRIYPKGFVIGRVTTVDRSGTAYRSILVEPAVDFTRLEDVLVVLTPNAPREAERAAPTVLKETRP
jgi:rod shape-determining protein MreC